MSYHKFLLRFLGFVALFIVTIQAIFIFTAVQQLNQSIIDVDSQIMASFKSATRTAQWSAEGTNLSNGYSDKIQLDPTWKRFYTYYYTQSGADVVRTPEYKEYWKILSNNDIKDWQGNTLNSDDNVNLMDTIGLVPMDYALPYVQIFPHTGAAANILYEDSVTLKRQDGGSETLTFGNELVDQIRKTLLQTITATAEVQDAHNSKSLVKIADSNGEAEGIPDIKITLMYKDGSVLKPLPNNINYLNEVLKVRRANTRDGVNNWQPIAKEVLDSNSLLSNNCEYYVPYYDLYIRVEYTVLSQLFWFHPNVNTMDTSRNISRDYHITYTLLS